MLFDKAKEMDFKLVPLCVGHVRQYKKDMQEAFQQGAIEGFGEMEEEILPEADIDRSLNTAGAAAYEAVVDGAPAGGGIVVIDEKTQHNHLDFLFVKVGVQSRGIGQLMWKAIEERYPKTRVWETCTPYFEKRNIHFHINCCGFHAVEFYNKYHQDSHGAEFHEDGCPANDYFEGMFRLEKEMKSKVI